MPDLPLPKLRPDNPENRLSYEGRQRIGRAFVEFGRIQKQALAAIETRYQAEPGDLSFSEYLSRGQAWIDFVESRLKAARAVLQVEMEEYGKLGLPGREFREIMEGSIDGFVYSLEFSTLQGDALKAEFQWPAHQEPEKKPESSTKPVPAADRVRAFMEQHRLKRKSFAAAAGISLRNLTYVLSGKTVSYETQTCLATVLETTAEELFPPS